MLDKSILLEVISGLQLPKNSKIRKILLQNRHGSDWNITVHVILVSHYSVQELLLTNCMRRYLFKTRESQTCSKSIEKTPSAMASFLSTSNKFGSISGLAQNICKSNILDKDLFQVGIWKIDAVFMMCQFPRLPI